MSGGKLSRRLRTVPVLFLLAAAVWAVFTPMLIVALGIDLVRWSWRRTPWMASRLVAFLLVYLTAEVIGVVALAVGWMLAPGSRRLQRRWAFAIQKSWAAAIFAAARALFELTVTASGLEAVQRPPYLLMARHTSIVDNLLHNHLISRPLDIHLRYVMKDELLIDPAIDIAGNRLPNAFVRRGADDSDDAIRAIRDLTRTAGDDEGVLIYPEGTRFSRKKLERSLAVLEKRSPELHALAGGFRHVVPPRLGGPLAMLDASGADVVFMAHHGLGGFARIADIWAGAMVGRAISVEYWRVPRSEVPTGRSERVAWLFAWWQRIDDWVEKKEME